VRGERGEATLGRARLTGRVVVPVIAQSSRPHRSTFEGNPVEPGLLGPSAPRMSRRARMLVSALATAVLVLGSATALTAAVTAGALVKSETLGSSDAPPVAAADEPALSLAPPGAVQALPAPSLTGAPAIVDVCASAEVTAALDAGDDAAAIVAAGGGEPFRAAVGGGTAPCVHLDEPGRIWTVVNKTRPYAPIDYEPADIQQPTVVRSLEGEGLRADAAAALDALGRAAIAEGAGQLAMESGYRSYARQQRNFGSGGAEVEASIARPGYSEHQSGLAADVVACGNGGCSTMDDLASTPQGSWIAQNAWRFGWIVRYEAGRTDVTGYIPEPWHLRYIGTDLAAAYHGGGWTTLEEFFGLPAAPTY
jgi:zinc D-Ala-D-Ala carboxypeptidase